MGDCRPVGRGVRGCVSRPGTSPDETDTCISREAASLNTVHLSILTVLLLRLHGHPPDRSLVGKLLILRLTQRGFRLPRLETTRSCSISVSMAS